MNDFRTIHTFKEYNTTKTHTWIIWFTQDDSISPLPKPKGYNIGNGSGGPEWVTAEQVSQSSQSI